MSKVKVVLTQDVETLGSPGDVVTVTGGYARNFLIPRGLAIRATKTNLRQAETLKAGEAARIERRRSALEEVRARLESGPLPIRAQAGPDGRLFGSVTGAHVAEAAKETFGVEIDRHEVHLAEPIRHLGFHEVQARLDAEVSARITVEVVEGEG